MAQVLGYPVPGHPVPGSHRHVTMSAVMTWTENHRPSQNSHALSWKDIRLPVCAEEAGFGDVPQLLWCLTRVTRANLGICSYHDGIGIDIKVCCFPHSSQSPTTQEVLAQLFIRLKERKKLQHSLIPRRPNVSPWPDPSSSPHWRRV